MFYSKLKKEIKDGIALAGVNQRARLCRRRAIKRANCETLSSKTGGHPWPQELGRSAVPSSALEALVCWRRWAVMQTRRISSR